MFDNIFIRFDAILSVTDGQVAVANTALSERRAVKITSRVQAYFPVSLPLATFQLHVGLINVKLSIKFHPSHFSSVL